MSITKQCGPIRLHVRFETLLLVAAAGALLCCNAFGVGGTCSISKSGACGNIFPSWGYYSWQVSPGGVTNTLLSEMGITGPTSPGVISIPVTIPTRTSGTTVHEVHGNISLAVWSASCGHGSVTAQVRDQSGNTIAGVDLIGLSLSSHNVPITATLKTPLPITSLLLETNTTQCGALTISWSLVME
jgi:hypothetical protein